MSRVSLAVLGTGRIAAGVHLPALARRTNARVVAIAESDPEMRERAARLAPDARLHADYRPAIDDSEVQAVLICLPPALHFEAAEHSLRAGKHVYLEKPLAISTEQGERLVETWRAGDRVGALGFNYRFDPVYSAMAQSMSRQGSTFVHARSSFTSAGAAAPEWKRRRASGGGALLDLAVHHFDLVRHALHREIVEVDARIRSRRSEADHALVRLVLDDGSSAEVQVGFEAVDEDRFELFFEADRLSFDRYSGRIERSRSAAFDYSMANHVAGRIGEAAGAIRRMAQRPSEPSFARSLANFLTAVSGGRFEGADFADGLKALRVVEAAERSAVAGRSISLD